MNRLSYGLLSLLSTEPLSGYDLKLKLNLFWRTTHSAIYPLLAELEEKGYAEYSLIRQSDKPDKKLYRITAPGIGILSEWLISPTEPAMVHDEMMLKTYCLQVLQREKAEILLDQIEANYQNRLNKNLDAMENLQNKVGAKIESCRSKYFGVYLLIQKSLSEAKLGLRWCRWIRSLYDKTDGIDLNGDQLAGEIFKADDLSIG